MKQTDISTDKLYLGSLAGKIYVPAALIGIVGIAVSLVLGLQAGNREAFFNSYVVSFAYFLSICLGALFFVILQHLTGSGWSVTIRRVAEGVTSGIPMMAVLFIPIVLGMHELFHWTHADAVATDYLLQHKSPYLNQSFFIIRWVVYFAVWLLCVWYFRWRSLQQDFTGDYRTTIAVKRTSAPAMILFGITITFAAFDLLMSRDPHWYSTIFGVYYFSGGILGFLALLPLLTMVLQWSGRIQQAVTTEHYHDMGKLIFAFVVFWAYIAFSQYMLIWYANIPEETAWFLKRQSAAWTPVSLFLVIGHFVLPFFLLISRFVKRRRPTLALGALWVLAVHYVDIYWLVMPEVSTESIGFSLFHLTTFIGIGGLFVASCAFSLRRCALIPIKDPRLAESLAFENV